MKTKLTPTLIGLALFALSATGCDHELAGAGGSLDVAPASEQGAQRAAWRATEIVLRDRSAEARAAVPARAGRAAAQPPPRFHADFERPRRNKVMPAQGVQAEQNEGFEANDGCGQCGDDVGCRLLCFAGEIEVEPEQDDLAFECLECGRETGFLGQPELRVEVRPSGEVWLSWDEVPGAARYGLHGFRWIETSEDGAAHAHDSMVWYTSQTELRAYLDEEYAYAFYVVAWSADRKTRSLPSAPVRVDP